MNDFRLLFALALIDKTMTISEKQFLQVIHLPSQFLSFIGVGHKHSMRRHLHNLRGRLNVCATQDGILCACERLVLHQLEATTVVDLRLQLKA